MPPDGPPDDAPARRPPLAVLDVAPLLAEGPLAGLRVGVLHGRLPADEKDAVMRDFAAGKLDVLVATTVIEVGVDVPNATVMVVLDADRFGVSQLHQLRGRVGRGTRARALPAGHRGRRRARRRGSGWTRSRSTLDGFRLAELDLEQRREGDVLGEAQSGRRSHLRLLSLLRDSDVDRRGPRAGDRPARPTTPSWRRIRRWPPPSPPWSTRSGPSSSRRADADRDRRPVTRIVAGSGGGAGSRRRPGGTPGPRRTASARRCSPRWRRCTELDGARFADLFAGSGAVGLEAASRGAACVLLVESDPRAARIVAGQHRHAGPRRPCAG